MSIEKNQVDNDKEKPLYISTLERIYGPPSQKAFGTAVFYQPIKATTLAQVALEKYRHFIGDLWNRYGEQAWMGPWKEVYSREKGNAGDIINELQSISDRDAQMSVPMFLNGIENPKEARAALIAAFDDLEVTELTVYNTGDGEAMSGLLIAAFRKKTGNATFLVFLMD